VRPAGPEEAVGPHHEVAGELLFLRALVEADLPGFGIEPRAPAEATLVVPVSRSRREVASASKMICPPASSRAA
jgi:hypothetical protein